MLMAKKPPFSMEFDMQLKDFTFTKEFFFKGANKPTNSGWKKLRFTYYLDKKGYKRFSILSLNYLKYGRKKSKITI